MTILDKNKTEMNKLDKNRTKITIYQTDTEQKETSDKKKWQNKTDTFSQT